jgi:large subunit ribosomal protein L2
MPKLKRTILGREVITKKEPEWKLTLPLKKTGGRGAGGRISVRGRGGGRKRRYRIVDFGEEKLGLKGKVSAIEYDPNRTAFLALIEYEDGQKGYILAPHGLKVGDEIICDESTPIKIGNRLKLKNIPLGTSVFNVEILPGKGGKLVRAAGTQAIVVGQEKNYTILEMPSKEIRKINNECFATIGQVSHPEHSEEIWGKAGPRRLKGRRPKVRGSAMVPASHPHGGGEGKQPIGLKYPKTKWGKPALGVKTRKKKWTDKLIIKRRK